MVQESIDAVWTSYRFNKRVLGIAVGERSLLIAEVSAARSQSVTKQAVFSFPAGLTLENSEELGRAFSEFLKVNGFAAVHAVLGVPARWLMLKTHSLPPVDEQNAQAILNLHSQALSAPELGEMVFDIAGEYSDLKSSHVTLIGMPASWRDRLLNLAKAAGINVIAVTPSAVANFAVERGGERALVLSTASDIAELAAFDGSRITFLRHLGSATPITALAADLRRSIAVLSVGTDSPAELTLCDETKLSQADVQAIGDAAGVAVVEHPRGANDSLACALAYLKGRSRGIDFLHPRLVPARKPIVNSRVMWAIATAAVITIIAVLVYADLSGIQHDISRSDERLAAMAPALKVAGPFVANMQSIEGYQRGKPISLACLGDITAMLPEGGPTYLTVFHLQGNTKGDLTGRAANDKDVVHLMDQFVASGRFLDLNCKIEGRGSGSEITFSVTFTYVPRH